MLLVAQPTAPPLPGTASEPSAPASPAADTSSPSAGTTTLRPTIVPTAGPTPDSTPATPTQPASSGDTTAGSQLAELLGRLRIADEQRAGYDRDLFEHWIDVDGDGCNTRYEVLIDEAVIVPTIGVGCTLSGGSWYSQYDGLTFTVPGDLDVDHVVALAEAWDSGASAWAAERRRDFANDVGVPFALIAVSAGSNRSKSDLDPADWLPPLSAARCPFVGAWIAVKVRWDLAIDPAEQLALRSLVVDCPATTMPDVPAPSPGPTSVPTPFASSGSGACDPAYPTVCIPPPPPDLDCGEITFRNFVVLAPDPHRFDGNHDGVGCET